LQNYFQYFSEIEDRFNRRRGSLLLLSTLDWALIETWREAGVPLEAVLRGIDGAFDKYDVRLTRAKGRMRKVNGLAWCSQAVMQAAEEMAEAAIGSAESKPAEEARESGFEAERVASFLETNAGIIDAAILPETGADALRRETAQRLRELAAAMRAATPLALDDLDRTLTVLEERLFAAVMSSAPEAEMVQLREQADRELAPYKSRMNVTQIRQVQAQFLQKRLLEARGLPRLSLFYMGLA